MFIFSAIAAERPAEQTGWIEYLSTKMELARSVNVLYETQAKNPVYMCANATVYDQPAIIQPLCPSYIFALISVYDAEIAMKRHERSRFLHIVDFINKVFVTENFQFAPCITNAREQTFIDQMKSHAACLMQKAWISCGQENLEWYIRLRAAAAINSIDFHQRVQQVLVLQDDLQSIFKFLDTVGDYLSSRDDWIVSHQKEDKLIKAMKIVTNHDEFVASIDNLADFRASISNEYEAKIRTLSTNQQIIDQICDQTSIDALFVKNIVDSMYAFEYDKFTDYLYLLNAILHQQLYANTIECGSTDGHTLNACGLNSLLYRDALCGNLKSLRAESCTLMQKLSDVDLFFQGALNSALSGDLRRTRRSLEDFKHQSLQFESAGTVGLYSTGLVKRPREDWTVSFLGRQMIQPATVQADMLELAAFVNDYNLIVLRQNTKSQCLLDYVQSICIFSPYQEIRFLFHSPGHYQAVQLNDPQLYRFVVLSYAAPESEWYVRKIKAVLNT
ncbi:MAG: hypothetical protein LBD36_00340 [Holosporales bacterium]|nr:hypothetical protein [Holosporales bacterium]